MAQQAIRVSIVLSTIVASGCILGIATLYNTRNDIFIESRSGKRPFTLDAIPQFCAFDTQMHCDPTANPLRTLVDEDPYVRMIMVSPAAPSAESSESSTRFLDSLFTESQGERSVAPPTFEQASEGEVQIGDLIDGMMMSAMRLSIAAEEMTSTTYYGTRDSAAEDAFVTMLSSLFGYAASNAENYNGPNQLRSKACAYGRSVLEKPRDIENGNFVATDETRLRLARRLSEVETASDFSDSGTMMFITPFVTSFRVVYDDSANFAPPTSRFLTQDGDRQQCLWNAFNAGEVSHDCDATMRRLDLAAHNGLIDEYNSVVYDIFSLKIVGLIAALIVVIGYRTLICFEDDEDDVEEEDSEYLLGDEYHEMRDSVAYIAVPLVPLRVV